MFFRTLPQANRTKMANMYIINLSPDDIVSHKDWSYAISNVDQYGRNPHPNVIRFLKAASEKAKSIIKRMEAIFFRLN